MNYSVLAGDVRERLAEVPDCSVQCCVTSPPYFGLRDYGHGSQIGMESTPQAYVDELVLVFREVRRVLRDDGTLWCNLGDTYASDTKGSGGQDSSSTLVGTKAEHNGQRMKPRRVLHGVKPKDIIGIPWRVAFALQADGWYLRQDIIWHKPNPMPESVTDRCTKAHEYLFLLAKSQRYYYNAEAISEPFADDRMGNPGGGGSYSVGSGRNDGGALATGIYNAEGTRKTRNRRSVWTIPTRPYKHAHFATFPPALVGPCILAGSKAGDTVLDPFAGSGTTLAVAVENGRVGLGIELNPAYVELIHRRMKSAQPVLEGMEP